MKFYLTSAIPYVNAAPHIGHAQEFVYADVIKRYHQLLGEDVKYLCGADENALKIVQAAETAKTDPKKFADIHQQEFLNLAAKLNVQFDIWQRGSDRNHHFPSSQKLWELCKKDIYKKAYEGLYCVGCEQFYTPDELDTNGQCFEHPGKKLETVKEENYFFRLSRYQDFIEQLLENSELEVFPEYRKNEALGFVKKGLEDFSISRTKERVHGWGVPVPGDDSQIMYVWFDALNIYQTGIGFGWDEKTYEVWSPQDVMVIGKGISRFHSIYWPAILQSAGLKLPKKLFIHGYMTVDGQKMSKTVGNVVDPLTVIKTFGTEAVRYYLLREIPSYSDGDYSQRRFKEVYNADLANGLGNLVARVARLAAKVTLEKPDVITYEDVAPADFRSALDQFRFNDALAIIWEKIKSVDRLIDSEEPWHLDDKELTAFIASIVPTIREIAMILQPFLPETSDTILTQFSQQRIVPQSPLFPRIT